MLVLNKEDVDYLYSIGFRRSLLGSSPEENRVFIKSNGKHPICINMQWSTPVGYTHEDEKGMVFGRPAIGLFWQTLDKSMHHIESEIPLFLGTLETMEELKILLKQVGINVTE